MLNFLGQGALALAPYVIDALMSSGLPEEFVTDRSGKTVAHPQVDAATFRKQKAALEARYPKDPRKVAQLLGSRYGGRRSVQGMKVPSKWGGRAQMAMNLGFLAMIAAPFIGGGGEEADFQELMAGQGGMGSSPRIWSRCWGDCSSRQVGRTATPKKTTTPCVVRGLLPI